MKLTKQKRSLVVAFVVFSLAGFSSAAWSQQYIAERLLDKIEKKQKTENTEKNLTAKDSSEDNPSEKTAYKMDPRLTPEYWGIEEDTII